MSTDPCPLYTTPAFITNFTSSSTRTSSSGFFSTAIISAHLPGSSVPVFAVKPIRSAALIVVDCSAASGAIPS